MNVIKSIVQDRILKYRKIKERGRAGKYYEKTFFDSCKSPAERFFSLSVFPLWVLLTILFSLSSLDGQIPVSLDEAIEIAIENNLFLENERLKTDYHREMIKTATGIPATQFTGEYGQMHSIYGDIGFGISQTVSFPKVYSSRKTVLTEEWESSRLNIHARTAELKKQVAQIYFELMYLQQKRALLEKSDSLYLEFLKKATSRFETGESNILEKTTAENQRGQIALQLSQLQQDDDLLRLQFQLLLNTSEDFVPEDEESDLNEIRGIDTESLIEHPTMKYWNQRRTVAAAHTEVERSKLLPEITLGYYISGMKGMGADDKIYNSAPRFQSVQAGLAVPIFAGDRKAKIQASKINENIIAGEYHANLESFKTSFLVAVEEYQKFEEAVRYFKDAALKNAETIEITAGHQFANGEIDYLEWVILMNQAIDIRSSYIEAMKNRNQAIAFLNFYMNK